MRNAERKRILAIIDQEILLTREWLGEHPTGIEALTSLRELFAAFI